MRHSVRSVEHSSFFAKRRRLNARAETFETLCSRITSCYACVRRRCTGKCNCTVFYGLRAAFQMRTYGSRKWTPDSFLFREWLFLERIDICILWKYHAFLNQMIGVHGDDFHRETRFRERRPIKSARFFSRGKETVVTLQLALSKVDEYLMSRGVIPKTINYREVYLSPWILITCREVVSPARQKRLRKKDDVSILWADLMFK